MSHQNLIRLLAISAAVAFFVAAAPAHARGVSVDDASWADTNEATQKYKSGKRAYDQGKLEEALARFRESYDTVASPNSHLMVARVLIDLKRYVMAYNELATVIEEAEAVKKKPEKYAKTADAARALRTELEKKLGFVEVEVPAKVAVKGDEVPPAQWGTAIPVVAGTTAVDIEAADGTKRTEKVEVAAGKTTKLDILPAPTPASTPTASAAPACPSEQRAAARAGTVKQTTVAYVTGGIGAAGLATFAVFGILDNQKFNSLEADCQGTTCPAGLASDAERGRSYQALANVGLGVGIVGLSTGMVLLLTAPRAPRTASNHQRPGLVVGPGSLAVQGRF